MLIAFEGPHHQANTVSANRLSGGQSISKAVPRTYAGAQRVEEHDKGLVQCFDGIGWMSGLAHAMTSSDSDHRVSAPYQMFSMPDTHLVFQLTRRNQAGDTPLNQVYTNLAHTFMALNESQDYKLFKSVTIVEYLTDPLHQVPRVEVTEFSSPLQSPWRTSIQARLVHDDLSLFDMLAFEDAQL